MADWKKTDEAGIYIHPEIEGKFKIHTTATDPETGKVKHRRKTIEGATMLEAKQIRGELKAEIRRPKSDQQDRKLFADFAAGWMRDRIAEGRWAESTRRKNHRILKHHIVPVLGNLYVDEIDRSAVRRWIDKANSARREIDGEKVPYSHHTLRTWWGRLKELINALYLAGHCDRRFVDWCKDRRGPTSEVTDRKETRTLTLDELHAYVDKARERAPRRFAEFATLAFTGMRAGELFALDWQHVDYDGKLIRVEQSLSRAGKIKSTKTGTSRTVPLVPTVADALQSHRERLLREQNIGLRDGILFPADNGGRRSTASLRKPMAKVANACGIDVKVGPQVLRRTFNTLMRNRHNREMVKSITGHTTDAMLDHYSEVRAEDKYTAAVEVFGEGAIG